LNSATPALRSNPGNPAAHVAKTHVSTANAASSNQRTRTGVYARRAPHPQKQQEAWRWLSPPPPHLCMELRVLRSPCRTIFSM
jgi:hypothetical protein